MYSELKGIFVKLFDEVDSHNSSIFPTEYNGVEEVYDSVSDFVDLYREKNMAIINRKQSSWVSFLKVDCLELGILLKCCNDGSLEEFIEEMNESRIFCTEFDSDEYQIYEDFSYPNIDDFADKFESLKLPKEKIANWYMKLLKKNPVGMQASRIINDSRNVNLFSEEQLKEIDNYKKKMKKFAMQEYDRFIETSFMDFEFEDINERVIFDYFIIHFNDQPDELKEKREKLIEKIVNNISYASNLQKEFVLRMAAYEKCRENKLPLVNLVFSDDISAKASYFPETNIIDFNDELVRGSDNIKSFTKLINIISHEVEHYLQANDMYKEKFNLSAYYFAIDKCLNDYLNSGLYHDYHNNYKFREIEQNARIKSLDFCDSFMKKYYKGDLSFFEQIKEDSFYDSLQVDSLGYHLDNYNNFESRGYYNVKMMCKIFSIVPEIMRFYPVLNRFFSEDGMLKNWKELACDYFDSTEDEKLVYADVNDYIFSNLNLSNFSVELLDNEKVKLGFVSMLKDDLSKKIERLFLVGKKIDCIYTSQLKGSDEKKYCYDVFGKYLDCVSAEYKFLVNNASVLGVESYLEKVSQDLKLLLASNYTMYSDSKMKLEDICNYVKKDSAVSNKKIV